MNLPSSWATRRSRFCFSLSDVRGVEAPLASATKDGVLLRDDLEFSVWNPLSETSNYKLVEPGDFVIGLRSFQHGISHSEIRGNVSPAYTVLQPGSEITPEFFKYYFRSGFFISQLASITQGIRQGQAIDIEAFRNLSFPVPELHEQRRIAGFLDAETARIDRLSMLRSHQIQLILSRTISALSETYEVCVVKYGAIRLRYTLMSIEQGWSPQCDDRLAEDGEWAVVKAGCVNTGIFDPLQHKALPPETAPRQEYRLYPGDLLMSRASGSRDLIGSVGIVGDYEGNLLLCDKVYRIRLNETRMRPAFVANMLRSHRVREHIKNGISGADGMANNLPTSVVKDCELPNIPVNQQDEIALGLERAAEESRRARSMLERSRGLLAEHRQALITAAVTGQFDVSSASGRGVE
ncbi:hypothetical protein [Nonomuraea sp. NPDC048901]|uniref:restriction endonuclease subunit S n=1 Tax=Nonomuraea sp. NPDC048901 TaxID=3155627 RepID=UPI0033D03B81